MLQKTSIIGIWVETKERTHARGKAVNPWYGMVWYGMVWQGLRLEVGRTIYLQQQLVSINNYYYKYSLEVGRTIYLQQQLVSIKQPAVSSQHRSRFSFSRLSFARYCMLTCVQVIMMDQNATYKGCIPAMAIGVTAWVTEATRKRRRAVSQRYIQHLKKKQT